MALPFLLARWCKYLLLICLSLTGRDSASWISFLVFIMRVLPFFYELILQQIQDIENLHDSHPDKLRPDQAIREVASAVSLGLIECTQMGVAPETDLEYIGS